MQSPSLVFEIRMITSLDDALQSCLNASSLAWNPLALTDPKSPCILRLITVKYDVMSSTFRGHESTADDLDSVGRTRSATKTLSQPAQLLSTRQQLTL